jgi:hypothetical protein
MAKPVSAKFVKPTEGSRKRRVFDAFELEGEASAHVLGRRIKAVTRERRRLNLHMNEERRQAGRTQAAAEEGGVIDLIIIALLVLQVILERLF